MSLYKRISTSLVARIDRFVGQIENHDAIVDAAIGETRKTVARARIRLGKVQRDGERMQQRIVELERAESGWSERARSSAADEPVALECLRRRNLCRKERDELNTGMVRHREMEQRLAADIRDAEGRLNSLVQQRNLMRTRQSTAEALGSLSEIDPCRRVDLEETFDRWEERIAESEMSAGIYSDHDPLESRFMAAEERDELRAELAELMKEQGE